MTTPATALRADTDAALARGDLVRARAAAEKLTTYRPPPTGAFRLLATVARRQGDYPAAIEAYERAVAIAPNDAPTLVDHASLLATLGAAEAAEPLYRRALRLDPSSVPARRGLALALKRLDRHDEAVTLLEALVRAAPRDADSWQALGATWRDLGEIPSALEALRRADRERPRGPAATALTRVEAEAGIDVTGRARAAAAANDPAAVTELVNALLLAGRAREALDEQAGAVARWPDWVEGQATLARMRWEAEGAERFARGFEEALARRPTNGPLWAGWLRALSRVGDDRAVIDGVARARRQLGVSATLDLLEARAASRLGDIARADALFATLDRNPGLEAADQAMVHDLRARRPDRAASRAQALLDRGAEVSGVAHLDLAWRMMGDPRADRLMGDPRLVSTHRLSVDLASLAETLRVLHRTRFAPLDQSLRGGTQTEGPLLHRLDPAIVALRHELLAAAESHLAAMPPPDLAHPLLRRPRGRGRLRATGSWSVRLLDAGFHVAHVHSEGWISSAFYVALPSAVAGNDPSKPGWLELGRPPADYRLDLEPRYVVRPEPGLLALFPSAMWHGTRPFAAGERLTAAFDLVPRR